MRKKALILGTALLLALAAAGCGTAQSGQPQNPQQQIQTNSSSVTAPQLSEESPDKSDSILPPAESPRDTASDQVLPDVGITEEDARSIALQDAGISLSEAQSVVVERDIENGIEVFEVSFIAGDMEYSYDISVLDGQIAERDVESIYD